MDPAAAIAVLTAMITPAVLISACGSMILSTSGRLGRVVDRVRALSDRLEATADQGDPEIARTATNNLPATGQTHQSRAHTATLDGHILCSAGDVCGNQCGDWNRRDC